MKVPKRTDSARRPLFTARATHAVRIALLGGVMTGGAAAFSTYEYYHSPYWNRVGLAPDQPVQFSHRHHAGELRIDCRFCHPSVETSADAGMPSTQTCLTCHSQLFRDEPMLRPVMASAEQNVPLAWSRVNTLPDHVHFNHSIHIAKGIACVNCHGEIADMALTAKGRALTMRECLECHRDPGPHRVGREEVFLSQARIECGRGALTPPVAGVAARASRGGGTPSTPDLQLPTIHPGPLTNCSTCHH